MHVINYRLSQVSKTAELQKQLDAQSEYYAEMLKEFEAQVT
jgi:hypothetical protein